MSAQNSPRRGVFAGIAGILGFSVLSGLLVTVMVAPALAVTGITASSTIGIFDSLPEYIQIGQQPERNTIYATYTGSGNTGGYYPIATIYDQNRQEVRYDQISPYALDAAVDGEDRRFFDHGGVDVPSVIRAALGNATGTSSSGASTLSMQLVKNIYVQQALQEPTEELRQKAYDAATSPSFDRKLKEMKLAIGLEKTYTKKEILAAYLNIAFFGDNTYGIQAAAQRYYSVDAKDLTLPQAASLIAIVQFPNQRGLFDPENYSANKDRRDVILYAMFDSGDITQKEYDEAVATPVDDTTLKPQEPQNGCIGAYAYAKWFCDFVVKNVKNYEFLGANEQERLDNWKRGGYSLYTTLDLDVQINAQDQTWAYAPNTETALELGSSTVTVQPGTGRVLIMTENKVFDDTLEGGGGHDVLSGGSDNDTLRVSAGAAVLDGGAGADVLSARGAASFMAGGRGDDVIEASGGANVIAVNQGDGKDLLRLRGGDNTLSLGGGISRDDLALHQDGNNLVLDLGNGESVTLEGWYDASQTRSNSLTLQMIEQVVDGFDAIVPMPAPSIETFDFASLAAEFDSARAADPAIDRWSAMHKLLDTQLGAYDGAALGGDVGYAYAMNGSLGLSAAAMQETLKAPGYGEQVQKLTPAPAGASMQLV